MRYLSCAHTHTVFGDGHNTPEEMIARAKELEFVSLGFSEHAHQSFDKDYCMSAEAESVYVASLRDLQRQEKTLKIWVGLEVDALSDVPHGPVDYQIGSCHYLPEPFEGVFVGIDGDFSVLQNCLEKRYHGDGLALARDYYACHAQALLHRRPQIAGHFDLLRKYNGSLHMFDTESAAYRRLALSALEKTRQSGAVLEINTGGMARGYLPDPYPQDFLLLAWREMDGEVTLTTDCHDARYLDYAIPQTLSHLQTLGFETLLRLGTGDALWEKVTIGS